MRENRVTLGLIGLLALIFMALDWSRLVLHPANLALSPWSVWLKVGLVFLTVTIAWRAKGNGHSPADERSFRIIFALIFCADTLFALNLQPIGILLFATVHVLLARRNLKGLGDARERVKAQASGLVAASLLAATVIVVTVAWLYRVQGVTPLLIVIGVYVAMLWASVSAAWTARAIALYPARSTLLMAVGLTLFMFCDVNVAGNLALPVGDPTRVITESLTWMFYAPALCLIALSAWPTAAPARRTAQPPPAYVTP